MSNTRNVRLALKTLVTLATTFVVEEALSNDVLNDDVMGVTQ